MRLAALLLVPAAALSLQAQPAPSVATTITGPERAELLRVRRAVWVSWFNGDTAALRRVLAPELIAISPDSKLWQNLSETIAGSAAFKAGGQKLQGVAFANDSIHRFADVVVMFSRYTVTTSGPRAFVQKGRATEVFVRRNGRWIHTSWHLDVTD